MSNLLKPAQTRPAANSENFMEVLVCISVHIHMTGELDEAQPILPLSSLDDYHGTFTNSSDLSLF